ncbi:CAP-associated domain-containing protein [uncultured Trichococcus sp.]|uniref:CAP-associated domain-containing protein n=1 Tax=uncultured Trichococcus sp. TaxID=189665 RepID=UPI0029C7B295|nr:CAP-associated domain-containing protein [uncultured Trichococcus sp.]
MKFSIKVVSLFILFSFIAYALPLYVDNGERTTPPASVVNNEQTPIDENKGYPLPVTGYESYIGQSIGAYTAKHGEPIRVGEAYGGSEWWIFGTNAADYIQIGVKDDIIRSLYILGNKIETGMYTIGMTKENVLDEAYLARDFQVTAGDTPYELALSKKQKERTPLIQFENDSFVILLFDEVTKTVYGMYFLSNEALLDLEYYSVVSEESYEANRDDWGRSVAADEENVQQIKSILGILRERRGLSMFQESEELGTAAGDLMPNEADINDFTAAFTLSDQRIEKKLAEVAPGTRTAFVFADDCYSVPTLYLKLLQEDNAIFDDYLTRYAVAGNEHYQLILLGE